MFSISHIHSLSLFWHLFYGCLHIKYLNKRNRGASAEFCLGLGVMVGAEAEGSNGWMMTFISEMRKKNKQGELRQGCASGRKSIHSRRDKVGVKMLCWVPIKMGGGRQCVFFLLTPGSDVDRRVYMLMSVCVCVCALLRGPSVKVFWGRMEDVGEGPGGS